MLKTDLARHLNDFILGKNPHNGETWYPLGRDQARFIVDILAEPQPPMAQVQGPQAHIDIMGKRAKDKVSGFEGIISSVSFDLYGCIQVAISPPVDKDGKLHPGHWLDIHRLEITDHAQVMPVPAFTGKPMFGATPQAHVHGAAEKPERDI